VPKTLLTEITLRALKAPTNGQVTYLDSSTSLPGFGVRVSPGGAKAFTLVHGPRRQRETIGRYPTISLAQARAAAKLILAEYALGKIRPQTITWDDAKKRFLAECERKNRPRTVSDYTRLLNRHFAFGPTKLVDITPHELNRRIDKLANRPAEQHHAFVALKIFFNWAHAKHYVDNSPCTRMALRSRTKPRERVLTDPELAAIYRTALDRDDVFASIIALLVLTGQRRGEVAALRWQWIDDVECTINLPFSITKNKRAHTLPYGDATAAIFRRVSRVSEYLFPASRETSRAGKLTTIFNGWGKCKDDFDKACGVSDWTLHDLRRTFATNMAALGVPPHITEKLLNHVSGTISGVAAVYNRFQYVDEMRAAVREWETRLTALLNKA